MGRNKRYMASGGLAFTEERDMRKLSNYAEKGWLLDSLAFMGYTLRKSEPRKIIYSYDICDLKTEDKDDYFQLFEAGGWTHVCTSGNMHFFSALPGAKPIYTDNITMYEKYNRSIGVWKKLAVIFGCVAVATFAVQFIINRAGDETALSVILKVIGSISLIFAIPAIMTYTALLLRLKRLK